MSSDKKKLDGFQKMYKIVSNTMVLRKSHIRKTALALTLVYLFLSGFMSIGMAAHSAMHQHGTNHAAQHSSLICDWMCTASSFVPTTDQVLDQTHQPVVASLVVDHEHFLNPLSILSFHIRPPPVFLS